ncbi:MAG TPA: MarR family transcriptional regulator, partial [Gaiellaceae bacterium]|nr:MarR family transcriptional regulator [Gaiellaceae bacterium]
MRKPKPEDATPFDSVGFLLSTLGYVVSRGFTEALAPFDLEPRQFAVLRAIGFLEGQPQQAVATRLHIPPSRMVALVDELEQRGLLERRADPSDRRVRTLHLTAAGRRTLEDAYEVAVAHEEKVSGGLSDEEREQLLGYLRRLGEALGVQPGRGHPALRSG